MVVLKVTVGLPSSPLLVVTRMTPLAARAPYIACEAASFNISMLDTSSGFKALNSVELAETPSMTYNGEFEPSSSDLVPRICMEEPEPGAPEDMLTVTPAAFPLSISATLEAG